MRDSANLLRMSAYGRRYQDAEGFGELSEESLSVVPEDEEGEGTGRRHETSGRERNYVGNYVVLVVRCHSIVLNWVSRFL